VWTCGVAPVGFDLALAGHGLWNLPE